MKYSAMISACMAILESSVATWNLLGKASSVQYQPGEEGLTDLLVLEWKSRLGHVLVCDQHTKRREAATGADWEWWFVGTAGLGAGFRVQAKVLNLMRGQYEHLHYSVRRRSPARDEFQSEVLIKSCAEHTPPLTPVYCLYSWWPDAFPPVLGDAAVRSLPAALGCGLLSLRVVRALRRAGSIRDLSRVRPFLVPLHQLTCPSRHVDAITLPELVVHNWNSMSAELVGDEDVAQGYEADELLRVPEATLTEDLPPYVRQAVRNERIAVPEHLQGLVVFREPPEIEQLRWPAV